MILFNFGLNFRTMAVNSTLPQVPRRSLVDTAIELIRAQIEGGAWKVGERIPKEQELADMLQVGRNTVREAVRVLSHADVLEVRQGDGTYVRTNVDPAEVMRRVSRSSLREHFELRAMLETEAARLAAINRSKSDVDFLRQLLRVRGAQPDHANLETFIEADLAFHCAVARVGGNSALSELYRYFANAVRHNSLSVLADDELPEPELEAHEAIVDAIERQDVDGAVAAVQAVVAPIIAALATRR
ncbi:FadR/GntR family transcriptional regulator [Cupriavidus metallidurans]|nr:FCD domain-containing protein [Cupriavidus metallidurans]